METACASASSVRMKLSTAVANAIRRSRAGLSDPKRPIGSFIFLGPTGVGKTEIARALAEFLFDDEAAMVRIDMSEYMERHAVARLIGAPPGYVGFDEGGQLTEAIRRRPYAVVLFDEIEKAHPDVFNVLLQVLDNGRLTDGKGRTVDFKNTVLIMTSNIGARSSRHAWAEGEDGFDDAKSRVMGELRKHFRPEFLNRVDDIVVFHPLGESQLTHIVDLRLADLQKMLADRKITLELTPAARAAIFRSGYDRAYGARPLKRAIQRLVQDPLAMKILDGSVLHGDTSPSTQRPTAPSPSWSAAARPSRCSPPRPLRKPPRPLRSSLLFAQRHILSNCVPKRAIIIGAGPAGLTAALEFLRHTDVVPIILEASQEIGGISRTVRYKGNRMDIGGHRFFSKSERVMQWWMDLMPPDTAAAQITYQGQQRVVAVPRPCRKNHPARPRPARPSINHRCGCPTSRF